MNKTPEREKKRPIRDGSPIYNGRAKVPSERVTHQKTKTRAGQIRPKEVQQSLP